MTRRNDGRSPFVTLTPTVPIPTTTETSQPQTTQIPITTTSSPPHVTFVTTTTTGHDPDPAQENPEKDSTTDNVESDSEFLNDFEMEDLLPTLPPKAKPQTAQDISFAPIGVDDDISDDDSTVLFATKKDVKNVNRKLNVLIQKIEASTSTKPIDPSSEVKDFMKQTKETMDAFNKTVLDHIRDNANNLASQLNQFKMSQQEENKLHRMIGQLDNKNLKLKDELAVLDL